MDNIVLREEETISVKKYIHILRRRKYIILLVFFVSLPFVFIKATSGVPLYMASAKLLIQENSAPPIFTATGFRYDPGFLATQTQIIKSTKVGEMVVRSLNLDETYTRYFPQDNSGPSFLDSVGIWFGKTLDAALKFAGIVEKPPVSMTVQDHVLTEKELKEQKIKSMALMITGGISVSKAAEEGNIVIVGFTSTSPVFAQKVVNSVASAYKRVLLEMSTQSTGETIEWMKAKADLQREKLEASEKVLQEYKKRNDIYTVGNEELLFPQKITELSRKLTMAQAEVNELESLYREISRISPSQALNLAVVSQDPAVGNLRQKVIDKEQEIQRLSKKIGPKHPQMIQAKSDLAAMREKLYGEITAVVRSIKNKYELEQEGANSIQNLLDQTKQNAAVMSDKLIQYEILNRDVEVNRLLYERLISRIKEYNVTENKQTTDVWVVEEARMPAFPTTKGPRRTIIMGLVASLMAGVSLAALLEYLDNTVKTAEDAETRLDMPVLGMVPVLKNKSQDIEKVVHFSPNSAASEKYKAIRTALLLSASKGSMTPVLVTSMTQKVGKTVSASNLAISLAQSERRVLLIDADLRRPRIHKIFGKDNKKGLSTCLAGNSAVSVRKTEESQFLHLLTSGPVPSNPSELLSTGRLNHLLQNLRSNFDFVIFDSPPMADVTDAVLISKIVDYTILVVRSGVSTYDSAGLAIKTLKNIGVNILGQIVNAVDEKKHDYYHYRYYGTYGSYYTENKDEKSDTK